MIVALDQDNKALRDELEAQRKKLNFYADIEEESGNLVVSEDEAERNRLLELAKTQILANQKNSTIQNKSSSQNPRGEEFEGKNSSEKTASELVLDPEQQQACEYMRNTKENIFITGKAGTGKSFLLDAFTGTTSKKFIVLAPTGIAALNVKGVTLHSAFGYDNLVNLALEDITDKTIKLKSEKRLVLQQVETIIIDEISMVRADIFDKIDRILQVINRNDLPFGGKQILAFGDLFQLPPITKGEEWLYLKGKYGGSYFYLSHAYKNGNFKFIELTINHRQNSDKKFFEILNRVREGKTTSEDISTLNTRVITDESINNRITTLFPTKASAEEVNRQHLMELPSKEYTYQARITKNKYPDKTKNMEAVFPITSTLRLKNGALVMMVANDPGHRWVNGTLGIIHELKDDCIYVSINKKTYEVPLAEFKEQEIKYINGKLTYEDVFCVSQFPLVLAYAITIHKSQGQTYQHIVCDIDNCFTSGQAYVALSRCASLEGLYLKSQVTQKNIQVDHDVLDFYLSQKEKSVI